ncbi:MAG: hypothetical protein RL189_1482 [Pseudomonadota bacterium]|jgi:hypothetical protein
MSPAVGTILAVLVYLLLTGCSAGLFAGSTGSVVPSIQATPQPDDRELPPVDVAGVNLVGEIVNADGNLVTDVRVDLVDDVAGRISHSAGSNAEHKFSLPLSEIESAKMSIRIKKDGSFIFADITLPGDISSAINAVRVLEGKMALKDAPPAIGNKFVLDSRKLVLVLPANSYPEPITDENILHGVAKHNVMAMSVPVLKNEAGKQVKAWTLVENLSNDVQAQFAWHKSFSAESIVKIAFAKSEAEISSWNGQMDDLPKWPNKVASDLMISDHTQCIVAEPSAGVLSGPLSATSADSCTMSRSGFPFSEDGEFFVRLVGESATEIMFSPVFRMVATNQSPTLNLTQPSLPFVAGSMAASVNLSDADSKLSCTTSLAARSDNQQLLPDANISFSGALPNCTIRLLAVAGQQGSAQVTVTAHDDAGGAAQATFVASRGWAQEAFIKSPTSQLQQEFGSAVVVSGDVLVASAPKEDSGGGSPLNDVGSVRIYRRSTNAWALESVILPFRKAADMKFGSSIGLSGDTLVVGAPEENSDLQTIVNGTGPLTIGTSRAGSGAAYVYRYTVASGWSQEAAIKAANADSNDFFGTSVAVSGDLVVVGAWQEDSNERTITNSDNTASTDNSRLQSGAVYVYERRDTGWVLDAYIKGSELRMPDNFGGSVAISGNTIAVGARGDACNSNVIISSGNPVSCSASPMNESGAVYVFRKDALTNNWSQEAYIKPRNSSSSDYFGEAVALSGDTLVVGAQSESTSATGIVNGLTAVSNDLEPMSGAVYVFQRTADVWGQQAYIKPSKSGNYVNFGRSVSVDGDSLVVGAPNDNSDFNGIIHGAGADETTTLNPYGAVYVYRRVDTQWAQEAYIKAANAGPNDSFGNSVSIDSTTKTIAVGAPNENSGQTTITNGSGTSGGADGVSSGAVYIYRQRE